MKCIFAVLAAIFFINCTDADKKVVSGSTPGSTMNSATDTIPLLLKIGGCYAIEIKKGSYAGGIVIKADKEEEDIYYSLLTGGKTFDHVPSADEFRKGGVWGRKIPTGYSGTVLGFDNFIIGEKDLAGILNKFILIETIPVSKKNIEMIGSTAGIKTVEELPQHISLFSNHNARIEKEKGPYPNYPYEIYSWNNIVLAENPSDIPTLRIIWRLSKKTAHPKAAKLMSEEWFWSEADDLSPFGNDDGFDAFYGFKDWREQHPDAEPSLYLNVLEGEWGMSFAHKDIVDEAELKKVEQKNTFYGNIDRSIIAVALGQIALEGRISPKLKDYGIKATKRAMTPYGMNGMDADDQVEYKSRFNKILFIFSQF